MHNMQKCGRDLYVAVCFLGCLGGGFLTFEMDINKLTIRDHLLEG